MYSSGLYVDTLVWSPIHFLFNFLESTILLATQKSEFF
jgi:hypothetical protein